MCTTLICLAALTFGAAPTAAQDIDLSEIFSNRAFYEEHGILRSRGDVDFVGNVWFLPGGADSTRAVLGVALSNDALEFVRTTSGTWRAVYAVSAAFERNGGTVLQNTWERSVDVESFDETNLTGETIIFQTEVGLPVGEYDAAIGVRDVNADDASITRAELTASTTEPGTPRLARPILLKFHVTGSDEYVVHPSHYYPSAPERFEFMTALTGLEPGAEGWRVRARLVSKDKNDEPGAEWNGDVAGGAAPVRVFGAVENDRARFGEYVLEVALVDPQGAEVDRSEAPIMVAGSSGWIADNWKDALRLIRYEATSREIDILEDVEGDEARIDAWNCFWRIRDAAPSTPTNEALQEYFRKVQIANDTWTSALRPGYLSDRGRVYITIGAPDDRREEPMPRSARAYEVWTYLRYNFQIAFVDDIGFNNYQLHPESISIYQRELSLIERRKRQFLGERASVCPLLAPAFE
ncbi:MAG TPA: GWxTD domain-containing protein [Gemmatimonadota bacterium]|nr:GWxTD domain-containing protein [Gemmatimonadota bacterium]